MSQKKIADICEVEEKKCIVVWAMPRAYELMDLKWYISVFKSSPGNANV